MPTKRSLRLATGLTVIVLVVLGSAQFVHATHELSVQSVTIDEPCYPGGSHLSGSVTLDEPAPYPGYTATLSDNHDSVTVRPASVSSGQWRGPFTGDIYSTVTRPASLVVSATRHDGTQVQARTLLLPASQYPAKAMQLPPSVLGGLAASGSVQACKPVYGSPVKLSASRSDVTFLPSNTPNFSPSNVATDRASFQVQTPRVTEDVAVTIRANGAVAKRMTLRAPRIGSITMDPTHVAPGEPSQGTVTLLRPAPVGGLTVSLSDNSPHASTPPSVTVLEGSTTASFTVPTTADVNWAIVTIEGRYLEESKSTTLEIGAREPVCRPLPMCDQ